MLNAPLLSAAVDAFRIPDLRRKLLCTFEMLVASRFIAQMPVPCADLTALQRVFQTNQPAGFFGRTEQPVRRRARRLSLHHRSFTSTEASAAYRFRCRSKSSNRVFGGGTTHIPLKVNFGQA